MKTTIFKQELNNSSPEQLKEKLDELRKSFFTLSLSKRTSHTKDVSQFKKLRRDIARVLTCLNTSKTNSLVQG
jgi:ribosomal protein L29